MRASRLRGRGKVWIRSLPVARRAGRMRQAAGGRGGNRKGSLRGGVGAFIQAND